LVRGLSLRGPIAQPGSSSTELVQEGLGGEGCGLWVTGVSEACSVEWESCRGGCWVRSQLPAV